MAPTTMKAQHNAAVVTIPGFENIAAAEVKGLIGAKASKAAGGMVVFPLKKIEDFCRLCYSSQSAQSISIFGSKSSVSLGKREYEVFGGSGDASGSMAYCILRAAGYDGSQVLFDPFSLNGSFAIEAALFSSGFPVNYYRKAALLLAFSRLPQLKRLDFEGIFSKAELAAEAKAGKRAKPVIICSSSSMQNVRFAEKNAKIAGVNKLIRFSRLDIEWLDAKIEEGSIDLVVSFPPQLRGGNSGFAAAENVKLMKMYASFFCHAAFFMKRGGRVVFVLNASSLKPVADAAARYEFRVKALMKFRIGQDDFELSEFRL